MMGNGFDTRSSGTPPEKHTKDFEKKTKRDISNSFKNPNVKVEAVKPLFRVEPVGNLNKVA